MVPGGPVSDPLTGLPIVGLPIGQPAKFISWFPTALIECQLCDAKNPILLVGLAAVAECPTCKAKFMILVIHYDAQQPQAAQIGIARVVTQAEGAQHAG